MLGLAGLVVGLPLSRMTDAIEVQMILVCAAVAIVAGGDVAGVAHHVIRGPAGRVRGGRPDNLGGESTGSACGAETGQASVGAASVCSGIGDVAAAREGQRIGAWDRAAGA